MKLIFPRIISETALLAAVTLAVPFTAYAAPVLVAPNGSFSGALVSGSITTTNSGGLGAGLGVNPSSGAYDIGPTTTQVQITNGVRHITGDVSPYLGATNNLLSSNGGPVSVGDTLTVSTSVYNIANGTLPSSFTVSVDGLVLTLTSEIVTADVNGDIGLAFLGTITSATGASSGYKTGESADLSLAFTETGATAAIGDSDSIDTPVSPSLAALVPEPMTMSVFGMGLLGLIAARRKPSAG